MILTNEEIADKYARSCGTDYESLYKAFLEVCELKDKRVEDIDEAMRIFTTNRVEVNEKGKLVRFLIYDADNMPVTVKTVSDYLTTGWRWLTNEERTFIDIHNDKIFKYSLDSQLEKYAESALKLGLVYDLQC